MLKGVSPDVAKLGGGTGKGLLIVDDLVDTGKTGRLVRAMLPEAHFATVYAKPKGQAAGRHLHHRSVAGHLDLLPLGHRAVVRPAAPGRGGVRVAVIARSVATKNMFASRAPQAAKWIASRSLSSGRALRGPVGSQ